MFANNPLFSQFRATKDAPLTLETPVAYLKGIGPERAKLLSKVLDIETVEDFLNYYPLRYIDRSKVYLVSELPTKEEDLQLKGVITELNEIGDGRGKRLTAKFRDLSGTIELVWFQYSKWLKDNIPLGVTVFISGRINIFNQKHSMAHPEIERPENKEKEDRLRPIYPSSEKLTKRGISQKMLRQTIASICQELPSFLEENLPVPLLEELKLIPRVTAYYNIHFPKDQRHLDEANRRIKFEEAFFFQLSYALKKNHHKKNNVGHIFSTVGENFHNFFSNHLPFELTGAQKRVLKEIRKDLKSGIQMNRLLQGDVGSGKTVVALLTMLLALDNGFQSTLMAPTEILAQQHYAGLKDLLEGTDITIALLTGSTKQKDRKIIHEQLESGELNFLIGTHAILEDKVKFKNLGLAIIDEQHRFGVQQRSKLWGKNTIAPHILVMTATPIPRTLAMSFYSDLDVSKIDQLPQGRKPIITAHRREKDRAEVYRFAHGELKKGRQIYMVYPLIEESETLDYKNLEEGYEMVFKLFPSYRIAMVHGRLSAEDKEFAMQEFVRGEAQIMVATTVIEVGVNVPNASVMIIESAERFGLSQLHQLRGRVGRGASQSFCILLTSDKLTPDGRKRIRTMVETTDGFKISEVDMELRGPGDILGTQQSGIVDFKKLDLRLDEAIIRASKNVASNLVSQDPLLELPQNSSMRAHYLRYYRGKQKWGKIS